MSVRREPPKFRRVEVRRVERVSLRLIRVTFGGPDLEGLTVDQPAASVRLLLPSPGSGELVMPEWTGNEFLLSDGRRPTIRTFTPWRVDADDRELDLGIVVHGTGAASEWAEAARPGDVGAISGPGRGYSIDDDAPAFVLAGDETAIPAITQLLERIPRATPVSVHIEIGDSDARINLPEHPNAPIDWHELPAGATPGEMLIAAVTETDIASGTKIWAAGEAAAVWRIRRYLFEDLGLPRSQAAVRGYWKHGRAADTDDAD
jgi:NADPH-dependent ferric siderophore reductase